MYIQRENIFITNFKIIHQSFKFSRIAQPEKYIAVNIGIAPVIGQIEESYTFEKDIEISVIQSVETAGNRKFALIEIMNPEPISHAVNGNKRIHFLYMPLNFFNL